MGLLRILFRKNNQVMVATKPQNTRTPISSIRRKYLLLGEQYSVELHHGNRNSMKIEGNVFQVTLKEMTRENFETYLESWYKRTARGVFQKTLDRLDTNEVKPQIKLYKMRRAWGRCYYQKNVITFNLYLIKTPLPCIEYIVTHELCHFTHQNHSKDFHACVASIDPDWKRKDLLLKEFNKAWPTLLQRLHI